MAKPPSKNKRPRNVNQLAKASVNEAAGNAVEQPPSADEANNPAAAALWRLDGEKGGKARAQKLSREDRSRIAAKAAAARWEKHRKEGGNGS